VKDSGTPRARHTRPPAAAPRIRRLGCRPHPGRL